jgi:hypothetical protein
MNDIDDLKLFLTETFPGYSLTYNKKNGFLIVNVQREIFYFDKILKTKVLAISHIFDLYMLSKGDVSEYEIIVMKNKLDKIEQDFYENLI